MLVSWGCAAGLCPDLKPGDLVLAEQVIGGQDRFDTNGQWRDHVRQMLASTLNTKAGKLFTSTDLVDRSADKQLIRENSQAIALDMESSAIAEVAAANNLPFLVIRSIADPVRMDVPKTVLAGLNKQGQVELRKLLTYLAWHPWEIAGLIRLGLHFQAAQNTLKIAARQLGVEKVFPTPVAN